MALGLIGKKVGMTRLFDQESGAMVPVTVIDVKGNTFAQIKTEDKDGYNAIQVAFDAQKESRVAKPQAGHFKKLGIQPTKLLKEFRVEASELPAEGAEDPGVDLFSASCLPILSIRNRGTTSISVKIFTVPLRPRAMSSGIRTDRDSVSYIRARSFPCACWPWLTGTATVWKSGWRAAVLKITSAA